MFIAILLYISDVSPSLVPVSLLRTLNFPHIKNYTCHSSYILSNIINQTVHTRTFTIIPSLLPSSLTYYTLSCATATVDNSKLLHASGTLRPHTFSCISLQMVFQIARMPPSPFSFLKTHLKSHFLFKVFHDPYCHPKLIVLYIISILLLIQSFTNY